VPARPGAGESPPRSPFRARRARIWMTGSAFIAPPCKPRRPLLMAVAPSPGTTANFFCGFSVCAIQNDTRVRPSNQLCRSVNSPTIRLRGLVLRTATLPAPKKRKRTAGTSAAGRLVSVGGRQNPGLADNLPRGARSSNRLLSTPRADSRRACLGTPAPRPPSSRTGRRS
jgi:hypothetical protein